MNNKGLVVVCNKEGCFVEDDFVMDFLGELELLLLLRCCLAPVFLLSSEPVIKLIVILQDKAYAYEINSLIILDTIDTMPNIKAFETHNLIKELNVKSVLEVLRLLYESSEFLTQKLTIVALQHIRQIAQESSGEIEYGGGRQPVVLITFSQRLCRGFNDVVNGYVDDGWSLMEWKI
ncbi:hypothetical protein JHK87_027855 [Glycine soja]|nr:hypothetical protein JHK87_027855 [Glycine soja]